MKAAIICIAKNEALYLHEWVDYHLNLCFDKIIICDNGMNGSMNFDNRVQIVDYKYLKEHIQRICYTERLIANKDKFDWLMFIDCDEFLVLDDKYNNDIHNFLKDPIFHDADVIRICWKIYNGGDKFDAEGDYSVKRFEDCRFEHEQDKYCKSIIKTSCYNDGWILGHGYLRKPVIAVDCNGHVCENSGSQIGAKPVYGNAHINHYITKTIGEYVRQKMFRGCPNNNPGRYNHLNYFWKYNNYNADMEQYALKLIEEIKNERFGNRK